MGDLNNKDLFSIASPFRDQKKEGPPVLDQIGEVIKRLWGRELELKFQLKRWRLTSRLKVSKTRWGWKWGNK